MPRKRNLLLALASFLLCLALSESKAFQGQIMVSGSDQERAFKTPFRLQRGKKMTHPPFSRRLDLFTDWYVRDGFRVVF